jgi:hypothetical protein
MTLKEKFKKTLSKDFTINQLEQIADEFAIGFTEWCDDNYFRMGNTNIWSDSTDLEDNFKYTTKELLKKFKREEGL